MGDLLDDNPSQSILSGYSCNNSIPLGLADNSAQFIFSGFIQFFNLYDGVGYDILVFLLKQLYNQMSILENALSMVI